MYLVYKNKEIDLVITNIFSIYYNLNVYVMDKFKVSEVNDLTVVEDLINNFRFHVLE